MPDEIERIVEALRRSRRPCATSSFQAECVVLLHMLVQVKPDIDTVHHFPETLAYREELARAWRLNLRIVRAADPEKGQWMSSTEACCARHKVGPLFEGLAGYDTWFTALRREQSPSRAALVHESPFRLPSGEVITKASPLADWTHRDVLAYASVNSIPLLSLYEQGYASIGCAPCTSVPRDPANPRSGRWGGARLECGIHLEAGVVRPKRDRAGDSEPP